MRRRLWNVVSSVKQQCPITEDKVDEAPEEEESEEAENEYEIYQVSNF